MSNFAHREGRTTVASMQTGVIAAGRTTDCARRGSTRPAKQAKL